MKIVQQVTYRADTQTEKSIEPTSNQALLIPEDLEQLLIAKRIPSVGVPTNT